MARPRTPKPITLPDLKAATKRIEDHKAEIGPHGAKTVLSRMEVAAGVAEGAQRARKQLYKAVEKPHVDPFRAVVFDQLTADSVLVKVRDEGAVRVTTRKVSDSPIEYLRHRTAEGDRIDDIQYEAARRYVTDCTALGTMGSNTQAIITHLQTGPVDDADLVTSRKEQERLGTDYGIMRAGVECKPVKDPSDRMLGAAYRLRRITEKLERWEQAVLDDLILRERPVGMIATRWGLDVKAARVLVRMALWKLGRVYEEVDCEFSAWVSIQRQLSGEAK